jgi:hypothetical protein
LPAFIGPPVGLTEVTLKAHDAAWTQTPSQTSVLHPASPGASAAAPSLEVASAAPSPALELSGRDPASPVKDSEVPLPHAVRSNVPMRPAALRVP